MSTNSPMPGTEQTTTKAQVAGVVSFVLALIVQFALEALTGDVDTENGVGAFAASLGLGVITAITTWAAKNKPVTGARRSGSSGGL